MPRGLLGWHQGYSRLQSSFYERAVGRATVRVVIDSLTPFLAEVPASGLVVDVGTGAGHLLDELLHRRPDLRLVGVEPSSALLARAAARLGRTPAASLVQAPAEDLPNDVRGADLVLSTFALKHWADPAAGLASCAAALRPGGRLAIAEIDATAGLERWRAFVAATAIPDSLQAAYALATLRPVVARAARPEELGRGLEAAGLGSVDVRCLPEVAVVLASGLRAVPPE